MIYTQESVCKSHTCHTSGVRHFLSCNRILCAVFVCRRQIVKYLLCSLERKCVCVVGSHNRCVSLQCVSKNVDTRCAGQPLRRVHHHIRINDSHIRQQLVVSDRILCACLLVGDDSKRSYLRACARRSRNCHEVSLFTHFRELVYSLAYVHKVHSHIFKISIGMLVQHPHYLCRVHSRAAAERDDNVRLELCHFLCTRLCICKCRVGLNIGENVVSNTHFAELIGYAFSVAAFVKEGICNNESSLFAKLVFKLLKSNRQTAIFEVDLFGRFEPKHILSPLSNSFDVQKMLYADVLRNGVSAPRAAAQRKRGSKLEVVKVTYAAVRRRCIDEYAAGLHCIFKLFDLVFFGYNVAVQR